MLKLPIAKKVLASELYSLERSTYTYDMMLGMTDLKKNRSLLLTHCFLLFAKLQIPKGADLIMLLLLLSSHF